MYKIGICGQANSGKDTLSRLLKDKFSKTENISYKNIAFADPIKSMIRLMFPELPEEYLTGSSFYRSKTIPGAFKDGQPLTVRQLLIDLGTGLGRSYKESIWIDAFQHAFNQSILTHNMIVVSDCRFINEFNKLKELNFYIIKLNRNTNNKINHISETDQNSIPLHKFDYVLDNNGTLQDLELHVDNIVKNIKNTS